MITFDLKNGDIHAEAGQIKIVSKGDEVAQTIKTRLSTFKGEYFYNKDYGVPYWETLKNADNIEALNMSIKRTIEGTVGVTKILSFNSELSPQFRTYKIESTVATEYNETGIPISQTFGF